MITENKRKIRDAFEHAITAQNSFRTGINNPNNKITVMLAGHPYILNDSYINMNIIKKLNDKGIGIITEEFAPSPLADSQVKTNSKTFLDILSQFIWCSHSILSRIKN